MTDDPTPTRSIVLRARTALTSDLGSVLQYTALIAAATLGWFRLDGRVGQVIEAGEKRDRVVEEVSREVKTLHDVLLYQHIIDPAGQPRSSLPAPYHSARSASADPTDPPERHP